MYEHWKDPISNFVCGEKSAIRTTAALNQWFVNQHKGGVPEADIIEEDQLRDEVARLRARVKELENG